MLSNPCTWFFGGGNAEHQKSFTHGDGKTTASLWHFSPHDNGLSTTMEHNIIWFAATEKDALKILREMFVFASKADHRYTRNPWPKYIEALDAGKIKIILAPTNQFYQVGWAANDTL